MLVTSSAKQLWFLASPSIGHPELQWPDSVNCIQLSTHRCIIFLEQVLDFSYKYPVTFGGKMYFLGQTGGQELCLTYIGVTSDFHALNSDT